MDSIRPSRVDLNANIPGEAKVSEESEERKTSLPSDKVDISSAADKEPGFIHKAFRGLAKIAGGAAGSVVGASRGAVRSAFNEKVLSLPEGETKALRGVGAAFGVAAGAVIGLSVAGPIGLVAGLVLGPVVGSAAGGSFAGAVDGSFAAAKGVFKGGYGGMKKGAEAGGKVVDWIASKFSSAPDTPTASESPKPTA